MLLLCRPRWETLSTRRRSEGKWERVAFPSRRRLFLTCSGWHSGWPVLVATRQNGPGYTSEFICHGTARLQPHLDGSEHAAEADQLNFSNSRDQRSWAHRQGAKIARATSVLRFSMPAGKSHQMCARTISTWALHANVGAKLKFRSLCKVKMSVYFLRLRLRGGYVGTAVSGGFQGLWEGWDGFIVPRFPSDRHFHRGARARFLDEFRPVDRSRVLLVTSLLAVGHDPCLEL